MYNLAAQEKERPIHAEELHVSEEAFGLLLLAACLV
jgi:hypothetical protein